MKYSFSQFILDTNKQELSANGSVISLSQQSYKLLVLFVESGDITLSKKLLIEKIWHDSYVTENSLDQSISKLRKALNSVIKNIYIKTDYGKGFVFIPAVTRLPNNQLGKFKYINLIGIPFVIILLFLFLKYYQNNQKPSGAVNPPKLALLLIIPSEKPDQDMSNQWLNTASVTFIDQLFKYSDNIALKNIGQKPKYLSKQEYINNQWEISPDLQIVTTQVSQQNDSYIVTLKVINKLQQQNTQSFNNQNLALAMRAASIWLAKLVDDSSSFNKISSLIPDDSYLIELYMRGLASYSKGEFDKAEKFFQLCIQELPSFYLARLQLAKVQSALGKQDKGLAILDTLSEVEMFPQIEIELQSVRGMIYNIQGKDELNKKLYLSVLDKYSGRNIHQLNDIKYNLSFTYTKLTQYDEALNTLSNLERSLTKKIDSEMLAKVIHKQSSILQKLGHIDMAQIAAEKSLVLFADLDDLLGEAKVYTTLARIANHQANYSESLQQLQQSLNICRSLDYQLGIGATLNEMIYVLMVKGQFTQALESNIEMQKIATDISYNAMLQSAKQFSVDISRLKKQWVKSEIYLKEHLQFAQDSNSKSALLKNKLLALDLYLDQGQTDHVKVLIDEVQKHIDTSHEIRLQPRLNKHLSNFYLLTQQNERGMTLLTSTKLLAKETKDGETLVEINNLLAEQYLLQNQPQKALSVLEESLEYKPMPYPFLLLKSKANSLLGHTLTAQDLANECKNLSNEWWSLEDERYLSSFKINI